jgi:hypothetical protein
MKLAYAIAALAAFATAVPASAATVSLLGTVQNGDSYTNIAPDATSGGVNLNVTGSVGGVYADVYQGTSLAGIGKYNSVRNGGSMTYNLIGKAGAFFTFIWGTVDSYNKLTINNVGGGTEVVLGDTIKALGGFPQGAKNAIVSITATDAFDSVTLTSTGNSFEHAFNPPELAPVPVPAAGLLLLAAVGGLGFAARRRKSA